MPTIKDIAREAGVSHGTVSNVLNKTGKVSVEKIKLVEEAAKRLGYVPNAQAQMLRQGAPTSVIVIIPSLREDIYLDLFTAIQNSMLAHNYDTTVYTTDDIQGNEERLLERLRISNIAAVITVSCLSDNCCKYYQTAPCPVIYIDRMPPNLRKQDAFMSFDYERIENELQGYIEKNQWKSLAFFTSPNFNIQSSKLIFELQQKASQNRVYTQMFSSDYSLTLNKAFDIVQSDTKFDAIITSSSFRAETIHSVLHLLHIEKHPQIIALGSSSSTHYNNSDTYELNYSQIGSELSKFLIAYLQDKIPLPQHTIFPAKGFSFHFPNIKKVSEETLTMLTLDNPSSSALKKLLPLFEAISGIKVKLICSSYEELHTQINLMNSSFSYDLIRMDVAKFDSIGRKIYLPLKEADITEDSLPRKLVESGYKNYSLLNGTMYALPFDPSVQIYLYRNDLFEDATLSRAYYERYHETLDIPTTMEQHLRIVEFFTKKYNPVSPTEFGTTTTRGAAASTASDFLPYFLSKVDHIYDKNGHIVIDSPEMVQAMKQYVRMSDYSCTQQWWGDSIKQFADGMAATTIIYSNYASAVINSKHSNVVGKVGAAVVPGGKPLLGGGVIGISRYSQKLDACRQFFNWYYSPDISSMLVRLGGTSPIVDAYNDFNNFSIFPWLSTSKTSFGLGTRGIGDANISGFSIQKYEFSVGTALLNAINGIITTEEAASMAQAMYDSN